MKRFASVAGVLIALFVVSVIPSFGRTVSVPAEITGGKVSAQAGASSLLPDTLIVHDNEEIVFADLTYSEDLPSGTEIEVWPVIEGEVPPWDLVGTESFPFQRNLWITDEETGSYVRFDVTDIVRAWEEEQIPNLGFVLRNTTDSETSQPVGLESSQTPSKPINATLTFHMVAVRPPKDVLVAPRDGKNSKRVSRDGRRLLEPTRSDQ